MRIRGCGTTHAARWRLHSEARLGKKTIKKSTMRKLLYDIVPKGKLISTYFLRSIFQPTLGG